MVVVASVSFVCSNTKKLILQTTKNVYLLNNERMTP